MSDALTLFAVQAQPSSILTPSQALWDTPRVLKESRVCRVSLWRWRRDRGFPSPVTHYGNASFWRPAEVRAWLAANRSLK